MITDILSSLLTVAKAIHAQAELASANQERCKTLAKRVMTLVTAVQGLGNRSDAERYKPALQALQKCLAACQELISKHVSHPSRLKAFKAFVTASSIQKNFDEVTSSLKVSQGDLGLALGATSIMDHEQDKKDAAADRAKLGEILSNLEEVKEDVSDIKGIVNESDAKLGGIQRTQIETKGEMSDRFTSAKARQVSLQEQIQNTFFIQKNKIEGQEVIIGELHKTIQSLEVRLKEQAAEVQALKARIAKESTSTPPPVIKTAEDFYMEGLTLEAAKRPEQARAAFEQAAAQHHVKALNSLGIYMLKGTGAPRDGNGAYNCFRIAASNGYGRAMVSLAMQLEHGDGVKQDLPTALNWYESAAKLNDPKFLVVASKGVERLKAILQPSLLPDHYDNWASVLPVTPQVPTPSSGSLFFSPTSPPGQRGTGVVSSSIPSSTPR